MRVTAARLVGHGQPLQVTEVDLAEPGEQDVIMDVSYAGVNPVDMYAAQGLVAADAPVPRTLGTEGAGTVDGRPVMVRGHGLGTARDGLWATAAVVPRDALIGIPEGVSLAAAAGIGIAGVTAWRTVTQLGGVTADDTVLVLGASGGVGSVIVSAAHDIGATVIGQTGHQGHRDWILSLGASEVIVADAAGLAAAAAGRQPTVVFDPLGGAFTGAAIEALAAHGRLILYGTSAGTEGEVPLRTLYRKGITVRGYAGLLATNEQADAAAREVLAAITAGKLTIPVDTPVPLSQAGEAFDRIRRRDVRGKLILDTRA